MTRLAHSKVHFIGIGGIGMCGLAELLHNMGAQVTGSDLSEGAQVVRLKKMGIKISIGHQAQNIGDVDVVVYSSAVRANNPEFVEALRKKIPLIRRAEALAELMSLKRGIAIAGSHGKTTTTSITSSIFLSAGLDPTIIVGGRLELIQSTAQLGKGEWLIAEADESDGSFTRLAPELVIITNIDDDHLDHYHTFENLEKAFLDFASRIPFYGSVILCGDDVETLSLFRNFGKRVLTYGFRDHNDYVVSYHGEHWSLSSEGKKIVDWTMPMPGEHNALNTAAAMIAADQAGISWQQSAKSVSEFKGVDRRFQPKGEAGGVLFFDDYGHHPTEIKFALKAVKQKFKNNRVFVAFQPHRYSRTEICWKDFLESFDLADELFILDIYAAGENPIPGVSSERLVSELSHPKKHYLRREQNMSLEQIEPMLRAGDVVLTLGAGDVVKMGERLRDKLSQKMSTSKGQA